ncbi:aminotransferase class I/II-fold pyridoxal phosphate-dependent enzyme [Alistipes sp. ZOR0009]|uniref:aminotransferase class I/II-fold pyridoxal phosphate-dependent enzyme n=1 Tax=Alistipes sp. ZOR0009 TaxID=1339253 RepID=UPI0006459F63|nr:aminotransferase class I/II-fold pyridoxal phosphate-dependent enzyme [Alistipes sp. ZOR0009]
MKSKIWLSSPHMGGREMEFVKEAFDTNWVAPLGANVDGFEEDLSKYLSNSNIASNNSDNKQTIHVAALSAGTAALHLAMIMLNVKTGDEVICQSMTFSASANPITYLGAKPIFVDSDRETWNICPVQLERAIEDRIKVTGKKPKAIIAVHLYGMPYKVDEVMAVANRYQIPVIEDAAEALGSTYKGEGCGTFGVMGVLSFNGNKIITTSGGGALVSNSESYIKQARFLSTQARDNAPHYEHTQIGYNYRMSNIVAGIGRGQMLVLNDRVALRRKINAIYREAFKDTAIEFLSEPNEKFFSNHWLTAIQIDAEKCGVTREDIRLALQEENIESRPLWKPMHMQPVFADCPFYGNGTSEKLFENGLCLPSGSNMTNEEQNRVISIILNKL